MKALKNFTKSSFVLTKVLLLIGLLAAVSINARAQGDVSFELSELVGTDLDNPTSLAFGPDDRLYVSQQNGIIYAYSILRVGPQNYQVVSTETILDVKNTPNHDDDGTPNPSVTDRQITGLLVTGTPANPCVWVAHSDPRIGGGGTGGDKNLDTNSGMISKLTWDGSDWVKIDVVVGLPRSEENHATNGMQLDEDNNLLYIASGGSTNAGSPSNNFAFLTEYALAAAILVVDLDQIENEFGGSYNIPTLDDPDRPNDNQGNEANDPFGGNDGLNQAKIVIDGPVQVHSPGYRNSYDLVLTKTPGKEGRIYTIDNGPNGGWGGHPENEGPEGNVTNNYVIGEPGSNGPGPNDAKVVNKDNLHLVSKPGMDPIYGGHPNPIRANPAGAGLYWYDNDLQQGFYDISPTADWPPVPVSMANPVEGDFRNPGVDDGALYIWDKSTNGMAEYLADDIFGGAMTGDLLAASFDNNLYRIKMSEDGETVEFVESIASGFGEVPLDVIAQPSGAMFAGTIWACTYVSGNIVILEPDQTESWRYVSGADDNLEKRHENSAVLVNGKFYILGGRGNKDIDIYDPATDTWSKGAQPPFEINHFQAVTYAGKIYVAGAFTGSYPLETPVGNLLIYDPDTDEWTTGSSIPRARGSAGALVYNNELYLFCGITNGHTDGWVNWVDKYNFTTDTWTQLSDAPRARDHFHVGMINGNVYLAAGRETNKEGAVFGETVPEVDVYSLSGNSWSTLSATSNIPTERAGAAVGVLNNELYVIGGESQAQVAAFPTTEVLNPVSNGWRSTASLNKGRHGTQAIVFDGSIYMPAGSGNRGGGPEQNTMEKFSLAIPCSGEYSTTLDSDEDNYSNADEIENGSNPCNSSSIPSDNDGDFLSDLIDPDDDNDGIPDTIDLFALDASNGLDLEIPVLYPFLNGDPGTGLFGLGFTGLMSDGSSNYADLFDTSDPDLVMGGAVGLASLPAGPGDALTNDQEKAFQFGFKVNPANGKFVLRSRLQGDPFFDGIALASLENQSEGIYIGNGDQDNYIKAVLDANYGIPGFRILGENGGTVFINEFTAVSGILQSGIIDLVFEIDPATKLLSVSYETPASGSRVLIRADIGLPSAFDALLNGSQGMACGIIASSGTAPAFTAGWDYMLIEPGGPYLLNPEDDYFYPNTTTEAIIDMGDVFEDDKGDANISYIIVAIENNEIIDTSVMTGDELHLTFLDGVVGRADVTVRGTDSDGNYTDYTFAVYLSSDPVPLVSINAGGSTYINATTSWGADNYFDSGRKYQNMIEINGTSDDPLYQTERYGDFTYEIPVPQDGYYMVELLFTELYWGIKKFPGAGSRVFDVEIEGEMVLEDFDIFAAAGSAAAALVEKFDLVLVEDGFLTITTTNKVDNAKISAIRVSQYIIEGGDQPPVVQNPGNQFADEGSSASLQIEAVDNDSEGQLSFSATGLPSSLYIDEQTGLITGTVESSAGVYNVAITVVDQTNLQASVYFDYTVAEVGLPQVDAGKDQIIALPQSSATLSGVASDPDGGDIVVYYWEQVSGPAEAMFSEQASPTTDVTGLVLGTYTFKLSVTDDESLINSDIVHISVIPATDSWAARINAGGTDETLNGIFWISDDYYSGGSTSVTSAEINGTEDDVLYQSDRIAVDTELTYEIPVANPDDYTLVLHYAETQFSNPGARLFAVSAEGEEIEPIFDIFREAGEQSTAVRRVYHNVMVTDGFLSLTFTSLTEMAKINAIEVIAEGRDDIVGVEDDIQSGVKAYPNPFTYNFRIQMEPGLQATELKVYDMRGIMVYRSNETFTDTQVDLSKHPRGIYQIVISTNEGFRTIKVVKK